MPIHLKSYIKKGEGKTIEFKETLPSKNQIAKTVVAFSNTALRDFLKKLIILNNGEPASKK
jgi:predicted HTH transcriptional regulator